MLHLTDVIQPKPGEHIQGVFRRQRVGLIGSLIVATLCITLPFFFLFSLTRSGTWGILVFAVLLASGLAIGLRALLLWDANALILTNQRLIYVEQTGLWHRRVQEMAMTSIHEISCESRGIWETLFRVGTLRIRASGAAQELMIEHLSRPERARSLIQSLTQVSRSVPDGGGSSEVGDLRKAVHGLVDAAAPSSLETVKALLEKR